MPELFGKVAKVDEIAGSSDASGGNDFFEFADISRPSMLQQDGLCAAGETGNIFSVGVVVFTKQNCTGSGMSSRCSASDGR